MAIISPIVFAMSTVLVGVRCVVAYTVVVVKLVVPVWSGRVSVVVGEMTPVDVMVSGSSRAKRGAGVGRAGASGERQ